MGDVEISGYIPGALGRVVELHGRYYHLHWNFGLYFEKLVATELAEYLGRQDSKQDGFWVAQINGQVVGSVTIDSSGEPNGLARLRWFILDENFQGKGIGRMLMEKALAFCNQTGQKEVYLWTFEGLHAAKKLYTNYGFELVDQESGDQWGTAVVEQKFLLKL